MSPLSSVLDCYAAILADADEPEQAAVEAQRVIDLSGDLSLGEDRRPYPDRSAAAAAVRRRPRGPPGAHRARALAARVTGSQSGNSCPLRVIACHVAAVRTENEGGPCAKPTCQAA
ncbi:hypothetical protein GCM10018980_70770 [Streptomyces capoamus]|uniref:Uncharacterized protein n=1 Tax=Streptomyces capoamus TaxID=68183 RepID=A0A919KFI1_9ACTN|nr:hypothetical protein GCM10010501_17350 [Streptomyces libani subsp. rufus]GHG74089.1 hypothetical protein GCM10018980_70770 [Streptomyces capoamus]